MTINFSKLFKLAHSIAKANRVNFASYRDAFSAALKRAWFIELSGIAEAKENRDAEIKEAAKMIKTIHHFEGKNRKAEHKISWKLEKMLANPADRMAARKMAEEMESDEASDIRHFFSPRIPAGKLAC